MKLPLPGHAEDPRDVSTSMSAHEPRPLPRLNERKEWTLYVAHHPDPSVLGRMAVLPSGKDVRIGRRFDPFDPPTLLHSSISREHCDLRAQADGIHLRNLSDRGTKVNGQARDSACLVDGDVLWIGRVLLLVRRTVPRAVTSPDASMIGCGAAMSDLMESLRVAASGDQPVLLRGETGTGKEVVSGVIHRLSARSGKPYFQIALNERPETLIASELFGHARDAFTGAREHVGIVEHVDGGTLLLDEIAKCSIDVQGRLLRFLETKEFMRVGDTRIRKVNVRVIAASNESLERLCKQGKFLPDLLNRLCGQLIRLPPLRSRREDIGPLGHHFLKRWGVDLPIAPELMICLLRHPWRDNVRELRTVLELAVAAARAGGDDSVRLTPSVEERLFPEQAEEDEGTHSLDDTGPSLGFHDVPKERLVDLLVRHRGNVKLLCREGRIARSTAYALFKHFDLRLEDYRIGRSGRDRRSGERLSVIRRPVGGSHS